MFLDFMLIGITCAVAIIAALWHDPPLRIKVGLIILAVAASFGSGLKVIGDDHDKQFMQNALSSILVPSGATYQKFYNDLDPASVSIGYDTDGTCHHSDDGMTCFFANKENTKSGVVVWDRSDVAELYANLLKKKSNRPAFAQYLSKTYSPSVEDEDFKDKVGILGMHVFYHLYDRDAQNFVYDDKFGVKVYFDNNGRNQFVQISPEDIAQMKEGQAPQVFKAVSELYASRFAEAMKQPQSAAK
jgi:hypothetical protein